jgi:hypothetical protein
MDVEPFTRHHGQVRLSACNTSVIQGCASLKPRGRSMAHDHVE